MKLYYLFCNGSRGDCEPAISLAQYIISKGDRAFIYSNEKNKKLLEKSGIGHRLILKNYIVRQPEDVSTLEYYEEFKSSIIYHIDLINNIDEKPDFVIGMGDQMGKFLAEKFSVPYYHIVLQYYHVPSCASNKSYSELILEYLEKVYRQFYSKVELEYFNDIRKKLNLDLIDDFNDYIHENKNTIVANSLILSNFEYIKHDKVFISGNINLQKPLDNNIEDIDGLSKFLSKNTNYIYLNLGSMSQNLSNSLFYTYLKAFEEIDCRVIVGCNRENSLSNDKFYYCSSVNQHQLFPKMKLIIQCGGLGTVFKAAYHGIPQLMIPKNFEEPFWADKVRELGIGSSINFNNLNYDNLKDEVKKILNNDTIYHNAKIVSKSIDINGVENIYNLICKT